MKKTQGEKKKFYQRNWLLWISLIFIPPVGLILLWVCHKEKRKGVKIILSVVFALWFALLVIPSNNETTVEKPADTEQTETQIPQPSPTKTSEPEKTIQPIGEPEPSATLSATPAPQPSTIPSSTPAPQPSTIPSSTPAPQPSTTPIPEPKESLQAAETSPIPTTVEEFPIETTEPETSTGTPQGQGGGNGENFNTYDEPSQQKTTETYVLNTHTMKFHKPKCSSVKEIAPENYATSSKSRDTLISQGYSACKKCHP